MEFILLINQILPIVTILGQIIIIVIVVSFATKQKIIIRFLGKRALAFAFVVALSATLGSLFYSEILGYEPCKLCWFQRILMYPQVIILGIALIKKDSGVAIYSTVLSVLGFLFSVYHYLLQIGFVPSINCSAVGYSVSCSQRFVMQFGYITIPMMALTVFALIIGFMALLKFNSYYCPVCHLRYKNAGWAKKCENWCRQNKSCNTEIIKHAIK